MFDIVCDPRRRRGRGDPVAASNTVIAPWSSRRHPICAAETGPLFDHLWGTVVIFSRFIVVTRREDRRFPNTAPTGRKVDRIMRGAGDGVNRVVGRPMNGDASRNAAEWA